MNPLSVSPPARPHPPRWLAAVCHACGACVAVCPEDALFLWNTRLAVDKERCKGCRRCTHTCPVGALRQNGSASE